MRSNSPSPVRPQTTPQPAPAPLELTAEAGQRPTAAAHLGARCCCLPGARAAQARLQQRQPVPGNVPDDAPVINIQPGVEVAVQSLPEAAPDSPRQLAPSAPSAASGSSTGPAPDAAAIQGDSEWIQPLEDRSIPLEEHLRVIQNWIDSSPEDERSERSAVGELFRQCWTNPDATQLVTGSRYRLTSLPPIPATEGVRDFV